MNLAASNPCLAVAPDIDARVVIEFRQQRRRGNPEYRVKGRHDGFPAYEFYVGTKLGYSYNPVTANKGPASLLWLMDVKIGRDGWTRWKTVY